MATENEPESGGGGGGGASLNPPKFCVLTQNLGCLDSSNIASVDSLTLKRLRLWSESLNSWMLTLMEQGTAVDILVVHFQEIGGKRFHAPFQDVLNQVVRESISEDEYWCSGLLMRKDGGSDFTAVGTVIWVSVGWASNVNMRDYKSNRYVSLPRDDTWNVTKFFYNVKLSEAHKSRKGFLATSLRVYGLGIAGDTAKNFHFINLHLFHDADNVVAMSKSPSEYADKRSRGLVETLDLMLKNGQAAREDSLFLFGDLNTRLDGFRFLQSSNGSMDVKPKKIHMPSDMWEKFHDRVSWNWLKEFDLEGEEMMDEVAKKLDLNMCELPREFGPTYSLVNEEDSGLCGSYKEERLPAWCDRVLVNAPSLAGIRDYQYWVAPLHLLDHYGVYLMFSMLT